MGLDEVPIHEAGGGQVFQAAGFEGVWGKGLRFLVGLSVGMGGEYFLWNNGLHFWLFHLDFLRNYDLLFGLLDSQFNLV